ncbi:pilin N-terminal domain-containing protein [Pseudoramibacter sp.]|uniref:pilin N-terminal domain-containing protein n=1 Tax=Pseudoramibacter sp. TaxID=2034862 RepID=UPI0025E0BAA2|nr:SpaA isopeptide-forming pilin-related protein [Pseudoramibacter sp.]MCH4071975.1 pilin N-terminal domain-containing protein [Pseudoramibacter sp.]MCH4105744.1 pilin N-terminal domain-containing protein [Pseudoramibacter sp.]
MKTRSLLHSGRLFAALAAVLTALCLAAFPVHAAVNNVPPLNGQKASLELRFIFNDNKTRKAISGAEFTLYRAADLSVSGNTAVFTPLAPFKAHQVDYDHLSASGSEDAAAAFAKLTAKASPAAKAVTDQNGTARFSALPYGMYLVVQTGASGQAAAYEKVEPFLAMAPEAMDQGDGHSQWDYYAVVYPKTTVKAKTTPGKPKASRVKTGDTTALFELIGAALIASAVLILVARRTKSE